MRMEKWRVCQRVPSIGSRCLPPILQTRHGESGNRLTNCAARCAPLPAGFVPPKAGNSTGGAAADGEAVQQRVDSRMRDDIQDGYFSAPGTVIPEHPISTWPPVLGIGLEYRFFVRTAQGAVRLAVQARVSRIFSREAKRFYDRFILRFVGFTVS